MLVEAGLLIALGVLALLLPLSASYRARLVRRLSEEARLELPAEHRQAAEAREVRRALALGVGILLTGLVVLGLSLAGVERGVLDGWFFFSLMVALAALCLALVEIWWPGVPVDGPRAARMSTPRLGDYLPPLVRRGYAALLTFGVAAVAGALLLGRTRWFDEATLWRSALPVLLVVLPVLALLTWWAVRRVLEAPQPARDETELYWQDVVRASTLSNLLVPPAVAALMGLLAAGNALDDAASVAAERTGEVGPAWTLVFVVAGYVTPLVLVGVLLALTATRSLGGAEVPHMRERLWGGQVPGAQGDAQVHEDGDPGERGRDAPGPRKPGEPREDQAAAGGRGR